LKPGAIILGVGIVSLTSAHAMALESSTSAVLGWALRPPTARLIGGSPGGGDWAGRSGNGGPLIGVEGVPPAGCASVTRLHYIRTSKLVMDMRSLACQVKRFCAVSWLRRSFLDLRRAVRRGVVGHDVQLLARIQPRSLKPRKSSAV